MGIFSKDPCVNCGTPVGLLSGGTKIADGHVCKACAALCSPFRKPGRATTAADLASHLAYRAQNRAAFAAFVPTYSLGETNKLLIDYPHGVFVLASDAELGGGNPDVFRLDAVRKSDIRITESADRHNEDSVDCYYYSFFLELRLDHPYVPFVSFRVNDRTVTAHRRPIDRSRIEQAISGEKNLHSGLLARVVGLGDDRKATEAYLGYYVLLQQMIASLAAASPASPPAQPPVSSPKFCPYCGSPVSGGAFCAACGGKLS